MLKRRLIATLFLAPIVGLVNGQFIAGKNEIGINLGALIYQGDLAPGKLGSLKTPRPALGLYYNRIISPYFSVRGNLVIGSLAGNDSKYPPEYRQYRNFRFSSRLTEFSGLAVLNLFGNNGNARFVKFSPYVFAGAGLAFVNIKRDYSNTDLSYFHSDPVLLAGLTADSARKLPGVLPVLPVGIGIRYAITPSIGLVAEGSYRYSFTDFLDGFCYAASSKYKDSYYSASLGIVFNFGSSQQDCPKVR